MSEVEPLERRLKGLEEFRSPEFVGRMARLERRRKVTWWAMLAAVALYVCVAQTAQAQGLSGPPIKLEGVASVDRAVEVLGDAAAGLATDPGYAEDLIDPPDVLGVEQITVDGAVLRTTVKTVSDAQWRIGRELRRALTEALGEAGITAQLPNSRAYLRPAEPSPADPGQAGPT